MPADAIPIQSVMSPPTHTISHDAKVAQALAQMQESRVHELPVLRQGRLVGWISHDSLTARGHLPPETAVSSAMEKPPHLDEDADLVTAAELLIETGARSLPIVGPRRSLVGVLSRTDVMRTAQAIPSIGPVPVSALMTEELETLEAADDLDAALARLRKTGIEQLIVVGEGGRAAGVLARDDVLTHMALTNRVSLAARAKPGGLGTGAKQKPRRIEVQSVAHAPIIVAPDTPAAEAIRLMLKGEGHCVLVVDDELPIGILSRTDIVKRVAALREFTGPLVEIQGLRGTADRPLLDRLHHIIQHALKKLEAEFRIEHLAVHYKIYKAKSGGASKYSVTAHLSTDRELISAQSHDWDIVRATDRTLQELARRALDHKALRLDARRARRRSPARKASFYQCR